MNSEKQMAILKKVALGELTVDEASKELANPWRNYLDYQAIHEEAHLAGMAAGNACCPRPMIVEGYESQPVMDGVCGFAWVVLGDARKGFAKWTMQNGLAHRGYPKGAHLWVNEFGQSMTRKEAYARAYADILSKYGICAYADSKMD